VNSSAHVVVIDSGGANLASVGYAFDRLGVETIVTEEAALIRSADRVVLPGVGNASTIMARLTQLGLLPVIGSLRCPVLGICLGMQLLFDGSAEGDTPGLGLIPGQITAMRPGHGLSVPHTGWNTLEALVDDPLLHGLDQNDWFYFVHGYAAPLSHANTVASTRYGDDFSSVVRHRNFWGVQFHPERSGRSGSRLLSNFLSLPSCD